jgi:hypothetical protein
MRRNQSKQTPCNLVVVCVASLVLLPHYCIVQGVHVPPSWRYSASESRSSSNVGASSSAQSFLTPLAPSMTDGRAADGSLTNLCSCECCYESAPGRRECLSMRDYEVGTCGECHTDSCSSLFSHACSARSATIVRASCIERQSVMLKLLPIVFIAAAVGLVLYGFLTMNEPSIGCPDPWVYNTIQPLTVPMCRGSPPADTHPVQPLLTPRSSASVLLETYSPTSTTPNERRDTKLPFSADRSLVASASIA